mmetsp:Transcript_28296/g.35006  ORF Transcript_28296/g.35006 Transcript_28296/m.35006 type:complete len:91 (-) Transcript_28296:1372-1644(-)|eukprot:CAMPEP_0170450748 /NCGR_PEP_ID=MMETSP0123-20130129/182_1 /TAXON_ID=182087 /ORGANISM="Favella ehrenbergii, Strain Fehren 1" /LENGTH=90 /DNA_ID=CAMNT_0010712135 /DNA_START=690 /DNA_END=962 /DNA_ORIENTATION=-
MVLSNCDPLLGPDTAEKSSSRYLVVDHLGDGTFGRALKCRELPVLLSSEGLLPITSPESQATYAVKVVRAVPRYTDSAKFEAQILKDLQA